MRIGLLGAQGTGKTTLAEALAKQLELPLITEQVRDIARDMGINSPKDLQHDPLQGALFQMECLRRQIKAEEKLRRFVSDRTTIDNAVYWMKWHSHKADSAENNKYYRLAEENADKYDLLVYVPIEIPLENDNFRSINPEYQKEIDFLIQLFLRSRDRHYITVHGSVEDRVMRVVRELEVCNVGSV